MPKRRGAVAEPRTYFWDERHSLRPLDFGHDIRGTFYSLHDAPEVRCGVTLSHVHKDDGFICEGQILFDIPETEGRFLDRLRWTVRSLEPLHLHGLVILSACGLTGSIHEGRWVPA